MPHTPKQASVSSATKSHDKRNHRPTLHDKIKIIDWHKANGSRQATTIKHFRDHGFPSLNQSTLSRWLVKESFLRNQHNSGVNPSMRRLGKLQNPEFDDAMSKWVESAKRAEINNITGDLLRKVATKMYDQLNVPLESRLKLSDGWLNRFKHRNGLKNANVQMNIGEKSITRVSDQEAYDAAITLCNYVEQCDLGITNEEFMLLKKLKKRVHEELSNNIKQVKISNIDITTIV